MNPHGGAERNNSHAVSRGRARKSNAVRARGRRLGRGRGTTASRRPSNACDPSLGWTLSHVQASSIIYEKEFEESEFTDRSRLFYSAAVKNMDGGCKDKNLPFTRDGVVVLFIDSVLTEIMEWMNASIRLGFTTATIITKKEMYQYLATMIASHSTGLSFEKTLDVFRRFGAIPPSLQRVRWISEHVLAYSPSGRGNDGSHYFNAQRDQTQHCTEFERIAFKETRQVFLHSSHLFCTLDDDLVGTRSVHNQVKTISNRKADKEGHAADAVADISRVILAMRFHRRGEKQIDSIQNLLLQMFEGRGELSQVGFVMTAERGYGKKAVLDVLTSFGLASIFLMPEHLLRSHPFVGASFLNPSREDAVEADGNDNEISSQAHGSGSEAEVNLNGSNGNVINDLDSVDIPDRHKQYVIDDDPKLGQEVFTAYKGLTRAHSTLDQRRVTAVAIREHVTSKFEKVLRFLHALPPSLSSKVDQWVVVPKITVSKADVLFAPNSKGVLKACEESLRSHCSPLTTGQRCADCFVLRQFRITGTNAGILLEKHNTFRSALCPHPKPDQLYDSGALFKTLSKSWFSDKMSTESMMRGSANESTVTHHLRQKDVVSSVFDVGVVRHNHYNHLAFSPDGAALLNNGVSLRLPVFNDGHLRVDD